MKNIFQHVLSDEGETIRWPQHAADFLLEFAAVHTQLVATGYLMEARLLWSMWIEVNNAIVRGVHPPKGWYAAVQIARAVAPSQEAA